MEDMTSIAVVVLDTLRKDAFEEFFEWLPGTRFENAWSTGSRTVPAHASLFTGQYPSEAGVHARSETLDCAEPTVAEQLRDAGYATSAFTCNPYISATFGFDRGFERVGESWRVRNRDPDLFDWTPFVSETRGTGPGRYLRAIVRCLRADVDTLASVRHGGVLKLRDMGRGDLVGSDDEGGKHALRWLRDRSFDDREFLFVNLMEAHAPYNPPEAYRTIQLEGSPGLTEMLAETPPDVDPERVRQAYEDSVRYLADVYREMFAELRSAFEYVITLGDHGECFGEGGVWRHEHGLVPELTHVPLCISDGRSETRTDDRCVSLLDVHRTILSLAGVEDNGDSRGRSLNGPSLDDPDLGDADEGNDPSDGGRYLTELHGLGSRKRETLRLEGVSEELIEAYDVVLCGIALENGYYGYETIDEFQSIGTPPSGADPASVMDDLIADLTPREVGDADDDLPEEVIEQLRDLGYA
jgi:arylsulfatase A-like enzyme